MFTRGIRQTPPAMLVDAAGEVALGIFSSPIPVVNLEDARLSWRGIPWPQALVRLRLKKWQHYALILPDLFVGLALVDLGYLRTSWCHVVRRHGGQRFEHRRIGPALKLSLARSIWNGHCAIQDKGYRVEIENHLTQGEHLLTLDLAAARGAPAVSGSLRCQHDLAAIQPLEVVLPVGLNRGMYSHKVALPLAGELRVGGQCFTANPTEAFALLDIHRAHYPHHTWWNWATFAGRDREHRAIALNLTRNVNQDDNRYNENGLWVNGKLQHLGPARFVFDDAHPTAPWQLSTEDGCVDLTFTPEGERSEQLRLGLIRSVFHQPYGRFQGTVRFAQQTLAVESLFGLCEDHDSLW
jgi:hypothetical protein